VDTPVEDYVSSLDGDLHGWRIALAMDDYFTDEDIVDREVLTAVNNAARIFEDLGAQVEQVDFPDAREAAVANGLMTPADAAAFHHQRISDNPEGFGRDVLKRLQAGVAFSATEYSLARRMQTILRCEFREFLNEYDLLITPTTPITAPVRGSADAVERARLLTRFTAPFNLTGLPALSIPCGWSGENLSIGLQLVGKPWTERNVLNAGKLFEQNRGWQIPIASFPELT
jgi:aspartyl-tRNA(Asn)/glutamyl-tRNA(Gln) amidotransferase subunit A